MQLARKGRSTGFVCARRSAVRVAVAAMVLASACSAGAHDDSTAAEGLSESGSEAGSERRSDAGVEARFDATAQDAERKRIASAIGWDFEGTPVTSEAITETLHVLFGVGGNVLVSTGSDGVLMVDDQFPQMASKILDAIEDLGGGGVDFVVNTHWHFDHADGNLAFGPGGAWLVSQAQSREMLLSTRVVDLVGIEYTQQGYPPEALPVITYDRTMQFHFNGERIDLMHFGPAHTTGDTAVIFRGGNVVHMGDVFNTAGYPFIDVGNGGDLDGVIAFCQAVLGEIDGATVVVPGHGPVSDYQGLQAYVNMLQAVRDRIAGLVGEGADLDAVLESRPTRGFDEQYGDPTRFIDRAYFSLAGGGSGPVD